MGVTLWGDELFYVHSLDEGGVRHEQGKQPHLVSRPG